MNNIAGTGGAVGAGAGAGPGASGAGSGAAGADNAAGMGGAVGTGARARPRAGGVAEAEGAAEAEPSEGTNAEGSLVSDGGSGRTGRFEGVGTLCCNKNFSKMVSAWFSAASLDSPLFDHQRVGSAELKPSINGSLTTLIGYRSAGTYLIEAYSILHHSDPCSLFRHTHIVLHHFHRTWLQKYHSLQCSELIDVMQKY